MIASKALPHALKSTDAATSSRALAVFMSEKMRMRSRSERITKIKVRLWDDRLDNKLLLDAPLYMNRYLSTPYHCAKHVNVFLAMNSCVAFQGRPPISNGKQLAPIHMHSTLEEDCDLWFTRYDEKRPEALKFVNQSFWRSCAFVIGAVAKQYFGDKHPITLLGSKNVDTSTGSFFYDIHLPTLQDWKPNEKELSAFSEMCAFYIRDDNYAFEPIDVSEEAAREMFEDNEHKLAMIDTIIERAPKGENKSPTVRVYRLREQVDLIDDSTAPILISNIHRINSSSLGIVHRVQGVALPHTQTLPPYAWSIIRDRATRCNDAITSWCPTPRS